MKHIRHSIIVSVIVIGGITAWNRPAAAETHTAASLEPGRFRIGIHEALVGYHFGTTWMEGTDETVRYSSQGVVVARGGYIPTIALGYRLSNTWVIGVDLFFSWDGHTYDYDGGGADYEQSTALFRVSPTVTYWFSDKAVRPFVTARIGYVGNFGRYDNPENSATHHLNGVEAGGGAGAMVFIGRRFSVDLSAMAQGEVGFGKDDSGADAVGDADRSITAVSAQVLGRFGLSTWW